MEMKLGTKFAKCGLLALAMIGSAANAATISFTNWSSTNDPLLVLPTFTVNDDTAGAFEVTVGIDPASPNTLAKLTGIFFDLSDALVEADIFGESVAHDRFATNTNNVGGGANVTPFAPFDIGLGYTFKPDAPISFFVSNLGGTLTLADWTRVAVRFQAVGTNDDSDKLLSATPEPDVAQEVPEPASLALLGMGLAAAGLRRRQ